MKNIVGILPQDAIIIDPFCGTGTTCLAVIEMNREQNANRNFIGIEIDDDYYQIAKDRINSINPTGQMSIFTDFDKVREE